MPMNSKRVSWIMFPICLFLFNLSHGATNAKWQGYSQKGEASFYASKYQSRLTASGERFDNKAKTAAHRKLPFGTKVKVTNVNNGKSVTVVINDRGPFVKGRIIDLTQSAFKSIGDTDHGIIDVKISVLP